MHQDAAQAVLDALGNGRVPGFTTSGPDGDGEADGLGGQGLGMATHVEASSGAIGEAGQTSRLRGVQTSPAIRLARGKSGKNIRRSRLCCCLQAGGSLWRLA